MTPTNHDPCKERISLQRTLLQKNLPFELGGVVVQPGSQATVHIPVAHLYTHTPVDLTVHVIHGTRSGPCLFVSAALHGDELNGVEICRRLIQDRAMRGVRGTLLVIPVVNVLGFLQHNRYFPDHRDLNRSFPGLAKGSLAAQTADLFMRQIVARASHGIDLHAGTRQRYNLPQTRGKEGCPIVDAMAQAFKAPIHLHTGFLPGSLRGAAHEVHVPVLLYEGGEAMRLDELAITSGLKGILGVMRHLGMLVEGTKITPSKTKWCTASSSRWIRAPQSGMMQTRKPVGSHVQAGEILGHIRNPLGTEIIDVPALQEGIIIGHSNNPLVHQGEALFHIALFPNTALLKEMAQDSMESLHEGLNDEFL
ncbi:MAG: succinylglutamate desuccinylase/aspartoacylase family protein [Magnetococcus sp. YQC-5]